MEIDPQYIIKALRQEVGMLMENRISLLAKMAEQEDEIARLAEQVSRSRLTDASSEGE